MKNLNKLFDFLDSINNINDLKKISKYCNLRSEEILDNNIHNDIIKKKIYIQQIEYKGTGKSWVAVINKELKPLKFLKKEFLRKEKNRIFYLVECPSNYIYLINTEGTKSKDEKYFLFID